MQVIFGGDRLPTVQDDFEVPEASTASIRGHVRQLMPRLRGFEAGGALEEVRMPTRCSDAGRPADTVAHVLACMCMPTHSYMSIIVRILSACSGAGG